MKKPTFAPVYCGLFPNLARIANENGYALAVHGSLINDMDLVAIPWVDDAKSAEELMKAIGDYLRIFHDIWATGVDGPEEKPYGRIAWKLQMTSGAAVDLSVMPRLSSQSKAKDQ